MHTIVRIVLLSFVLILIHYLFFLYHCKFLSRGLLRISRDVNDHSALVKPTKKILAKVSCPKRILESKISNPTNPSIISVTKIPEYLHCGFVPPQISLSKVFISAYDVLITSKLSITMLSRRYLQVKRKQPRMGKEPSILYFLETEIHSTGKRSTINSGENA